MASPSPVYNKSLSEPDKAPPVSQPISWVTKNKVCLVVVLCLALGGSATAALAVAGFATNILIGTGIGTVVVTTGAGLFTRRWRQLPPNTPGTVKKVSTITSTIRSANAAAPVLQQVIVVNTDNSPSQSSQPNPNSAAPSNSSGPSVAERTQTYEKLASPRSSVPKAPLKPPPKSILKLKNDKFSSLPVPIQPNGSNSAYTRSSTPPLPKRLTVAEATRIYNSHNKESSTKIEAEETEETEGGVVRIRRRKSIAPPTDSSVANDEQPSVEVMSIPSRDSGNTHLSTHSLWEKESISTRGEEQGIWDNVARLLEVHQGSFKEFAENLRNSSLDLSIGDEARPTLEPLLKKGDVDGIVVWLKKQKSMEPEQFITPPTSPRNINPSISVGSSPLPPLNEADNKEKAAGSGEQGKYPYNVPNSVLTSIKKLMKQVMKEEALQQEGNVDLVSRSVNVIVGATDKDIKEYHLEQFLNDLDSCAQDQQFYDFVELVIAKLNSQKQSLEQQTRTSEQQAQISEKQAQIQFLKFCLPKRSLSPNESIQEKNKTDTVISRGRPLIALTDNVTR